MMETVKEAKNIFQLFSQQFDDTDTFFKQK